MATEIHPLVKDYDFKAMQPHIDKLREEQRPVYDKAVAEYDEAEDRDDEGRATVLDEITIHHGPDTGYYI